jgi:hypothetical protein
VTAQEVYDSIKAWFSQDDVLMGMQNGECLYRGNDHDPRSRIRCAFGCLIPDKLYHQRMEWLTIHDVLRDYPDLEASLSLTSDALTFARDAQEAHDNNAPHKGAFLGRLHSLAAEYGLQA